jgi:hypothetical protein
MINLATKRVSETSKLQLKDADGADMAGAFVVVYGRGSKQYREFEAQKQSAMLEQMASSQDGKVKMTAAQLNSQKIDRLVACTAEFIGVELDGLKGQELSRAIYADPALGYLADQVSDYMDKWSNFMQALPAA